MKDKLAALRELEEIVERLRAPDGCPWDRTRTIENMAPSLLEEACEAIDAIHEGAGAASPAVCEELGDLLMNVLLIARISEEAGGFGIAGVARGISAKLIRRHPHVFGQERVSSVEEVLARWKAIKAAEKQAPEEKAGVKNTRGESRLGRVPRSLPGLAAAMKVGERAAEVGFDWPDARGALDKVEEEAREVRQALDASPPEAPPEAKPGPAEALHREVGDLLLAAVNLARKAGVDPERALRSAVDRFIRRFQSVESRCDVTSATLGEMEAHWNAAKIDER